MLGLKWKVWLYFPVNPGDTDVTQRCPHGTSPYASTSSESSGTAATGSPVTFGGRYVQM